MYKTYTGRVIYDHLPKTAGQAVNAWLTKELGEEKVTPAFKKVAHADAIKLYGKEYSIISGHIDFSGDELSALYQYVTLLRDPIERVISNLFFLRNNHARDDMNGEVYDAVNEFIDSEGDILRDNLRFRISNRYVTHFSEIGRDSYSSDKERVDYAIENIKRYDVIGFNDFMANFLADFSSLLGIKTPSKIDEVNVTHNKPVMESISPQFLERLIELNRLDIEFYKKLREWYFQQKRVEKPFKTVVIHFGADKTGSTSIQSVCDKERERLYQSGIYYPKGVWHAILGSCFCNHPEYYIENHLEKVSDRDYLRKRDSEYLKSLRNELFDKSGEYLIFSYEGFPSLDEDTLKKFKSFVLEYAQECKILYYIRSPESYAVSAMSQRVKMGFLSWVENSLPVQPHMSTLSRAIQVFEKENCVVRLFDRQALLGEDVIVDFLSQLEVSHDIMHDIAKRAVSENNSLSLEGLLIGEKVIQLVSNQNLPSRVFRSIFKHLFEQIAGQKIELTQHQANTIKETSKIHTEYLKIEFGIIFPESEQQYSDVKCPSISSETAESIAQLIIELAAPDLAKGQNKEVSSSEFQLLHAILKEGYDIIHGQTLCFEVEFAIDREIAELEAGLHILDTQKRWAFGTNSTLQKQVMYSVLPGIYRTSHYVIADLPEGIYTAGFAFAEKLTDGSTKELMWYDKLCKFRVSHHSDRVGVGYANLPATQLLTQIEPLVKNLILDGAGHIVCNTVPVQMKPSEYIDLEVEIFSNTDIA